MYWYLVWNVKMEGIIEIPSIEEMENWLSKKLLRRDRSEIILYLFIITHIIVFSSLTILRHYAFKTRAWDLGIFTQSLWTTLNANGFFYHTCELPINPSGSFFGVHFSPILFLILPLYWIAQTPETLLVFQSFILALAALPIYKLAKEYAGGRIVGLVFAFAYLMFPATHFVNWYDFHVQAFLPLFFACIIYYITKEDWPKYFLFAFLSLMCQEHVAFFMFFISIYIIWKYRAPIISAIRRKNFAEKKLLIPLFTMIISVVWYWFTLWQRDTFFPTNPEALGEFLGLGNFAILGAENPLEVPLLMMLRPLNAVQALMYDAHLKLLYIVLIFGPLAFFSFKAPSALIPALPWFGFSLISQTYHHHILGTQYEAYIVSFIFCAAIFAVRKNYLKKPGFKIVRSSVKKIMVFSLIFFVAVSPVGPVVNVLFPDYTSIYRGEHERLLGEVLNAVPLNASILTQDNLFPHVSHRINAYVFLTRWINSNINDLVIEFVNQTMDTVDYVLVDSKTDPIATGLILSLLETKPQFKLLTSKDNGKILLFRRQP
jgi:uncharacterized membrane protein